MKVTWLPAAQDALFAIGDQLAQTNPADAIQLESRIDEAVGGLAEHPMVGTVGRTRGTREFAVPKTPCVVVFRVEGDDVIVLRIIDTRPDGILGMQDDEE